MPRFRVFRTKRYEAYVTASTVQLAIAMAPDVLGREWRLVEDKTEEKAFATAADDADVDDYDGAS